MILSTPNYLLEIYLNSASSDEELLFAVSWIDHNNGATLGSYGGQTNGTTPVTMVSAPSTGTKRQIQELSVYNPNATAVTVIVQIKNNLANITSVKKKQQIEAYKTLQYTENGGWLITDVDVAALAAQLTVTQNKVTVLETDVSSLQDATEGIPEYTFINPDKIATSATNIGLQLRYYAPSSFTSALPPTPSENHPFLVVKSDGTVDAYDSYGWNEFSAHYTNVTQNHWTLAQLNNNYVNTSGDTMTGTLNTPQLSATTVRAINYSGIYLGSNIQDVRIQSLASGQSLEYNGSSWVNTNPVKAFSQLTDAFFIDDSNAGKLVYVREDGTGLSHLASSLFQPAGDYAYLSGAEFSGNVTVFAHLAAVTKSFLIKHPFFPLKKLLRYACLEGPENGVYVRGRLINSDIIELPDYWRKLVDPDSITVQITPIGSNQKLFIKKVENNKVYLDYESFTDYIKIDCYYLVQAERCDVPKLIVEL